MKYQVKGNKIFIYGKDDFNPQHILECGQIFAFEKIDNIWRVYSHKERAEIVESDEGYIITCTNPEYFKSFFDLDTDYSSIKGELSKKELLRDAIKFGYGIRILKNDLFEMLISFIVSANNNIKRIQLILNRLRSALGENMGDYFAFPTREALISVDVNFFKGIGCGYRASYLYKVVRQIDDKTLNEWRGLGTAELRRKLIELSGVGPKVADCILLFGYGKQDVFPVDTWINQMYNKFYDPLENREQIRRNLVSEFRELSGYAQQYLFYSMKEKNQ